MGAFRLEVRIDRPPREVFRVLSEVAAMPSWYEAVRQVILLTSGVAGLGARYDIVRRLPGGAVVNQIAVIGSVPDLRFAIRSVTGPTPFV
jgi:uncharacterized protein YndB with AHSA1/START domain